MIFVTSFDLPNYDPLQGLWFSAFPPDTIRTENCLPHSNPRVERYHARGCSILLPGLFPVQTATHSLILRFHALRLARRENSEASRLLGSTSLRFALHGWQRLRWIREGETVSFCSNAPASPLWEFPAGTRLASRFLSLSLLCHTCHTCRTCDSPLRSPAAINAQTGWCLLSVEDKPGT